MRTLTVIGCVLAALAAADDVPAPAPAPAPAKKNTGQWSCGPHVRDDVQRLRRRIDALWGSPQQLCEEIFSNGWHWNPPDAAWRAARTRQPPQREQWYRRPIGVWLPHIFFHNELPAPPCPNDCCIGKDSMVDVKSKEWPSNVVRVFGVHDHWWLDTCLLKCRRCGRRFRLTDPKSIAQYPIHVRSFYNIFKGKKYAVEADLVRPSVDGVDGVDVSVIVDLHTGEADRGRLGPARHSSYSTNTPAFLHRILLRPDAELLGTSWSSHFGREDKQHQSTSSSTSARCC